MKQAKTLSLLMAIVLAFVFIGSPAVVLSAEGDEHPWDEEYVSSEGLDNSSNGTAGAVDTTIILSEWFKISGEGDGDSFFDWLWNYSEIMLYIHYLELFGELPPAGQSSANEDGVRK